MSDPIPTPEFEEKVRLALAAPAAKASFVGGLRSKLVEKAAHQNKRPARFLPRPAWQWMLAVISLLLIVFLAVGPQRVVSAMQKLLGYIPGVGIIDQGAPIRVLAEPVTLERSGVTVTVKSALLSADRTVIQVAVTGIPRDAYPTDESIGCWGVANLRLPDGTLLQGAHLGAGGWTHFESNLEYGPVPGDINEATLVFACIGFTKPGSLPENWEIPLRFVPAPPDMTIAPVIELSTPVAPSPGAPEVTSTPALSNTMSNEGITFTLEKYVEVDGGYQLYGSLDLTDLVLPAQGYFNTFASIVMTDANGERVPLEAVQPESQSNQPYDPNKIQWIYRTDQKAFHGQLTLTIPWVQVQISPQVPFQLDLGTNPQFGQTWEIDQDVVFAGSTVHLLSARLLQSEDPQWVAYLEFTYEDQQGGIFLSVQDDVPQLPLVQVMGGGGGGGPVSGIMSTRMDYAQIPTGLRHFTLSADMPYRIDGPWQVVWDPPASSEPVPTPSPQACLTSEKWAQLQAQPVVLPAGLGGRLLYTTDVIAPEVNLFEVNLDGSQSRALFNGYYPALSPDGTRIAYMSDDVGLYIYDLDSGQNLLLGYGTDPIWSPTGTRLLYSDTTDLFVVNADGTGAQKLVVDSPRLSPVGWSPDEQTVILGAQVGDIYNLYQHVFKTYNLRTGEITSLFPLNIKTPIAAVSPDGRWIAYNARAFGTVPDGAVFISRLDGSDTRRVAMLDDTFAFHPVWSPDGQWLIVNVIEPYQPVTPVLVNPFTCQVAPLPRYGGEVYSWRP